MGLTDRGIEFPDGADSARLARDQMQTMAETADDAIAEVAAGVLLRTHDVTIGAADDQVDVPVVGTDGTIRIAGSLAATGNVFFRFGADATDGAYRGIRWTIRGDSTTTVDTPTDRVLAVGAGVSGFVINLNFVRRSPTACFVEGRAYGRDTAANADRQIVQFGTTYSGTAFTFIRFLAGGNFAANTRFTVFETDST